MVWSFTQVQYSPSGDILSYQSRRKLVIPLITGCNCCEIFNPLRAKFFRESINIYLHFVSYLHIDVMQVVEIFPQIRQEPTYST